MKRSNIILLVLIAAAIAVIISLVGDFSTYETFSSAANKAGTEFQVIGELQKDRPMVYDPKEDANFFSFYVKDKEGGSSQVIYRGSKPTDFEKSEQIVLTGSMDSKGVFQCSNILMKCPSKYTPDEETMSKEIQAKARL